MTWYGLYDVENDVFEPTIFGTNEISVRDEALQFIVSQKLLRVEGNYYHNCLNTGEFAEDIEVAIENMDGEEIFNYAEYEVLSLDPRLDIELVDDDTEHGGTSFAGETLGDFLLGDEETQEYGLAETISGANRQIINEILSECDIKPIDW
ncbi:TPA: hypothetical protein ACGQOI_001657 [Streptococcus agalactiae]